MTKRLANMRSGDLAEGLGLEMLRSLALVSPVPRPEDVGLDAFATLLKPKEERSYPAASEVFAVQAKSWNVGNIKITLEQRRFFLGLRLPLLFLRVDRFGPRAAVYSSLPLLNHLLRNDEEVQVSFADSDGAVGLGDPIIDWTTGDQAADDWHEKSYAALVRDLEVLLEAGKQRLIGVTLTSTPTSKTLGVTNESMRARLRALAPEVRVAAHEALAGGDEQSEISYVLEDLLRALIEAGLANKNAIKGFDALRTSGSGQVRRQERVARTPRILVEPSEDSGD